MPPDRPLARAGLARAILVFFAGLVAAGFLIGILNDPFSTIEAASVDAATSPQADRGRNYITAFWGALPFIVVFLGLVQLLAAAASERRLPGQ